MTKRTPRAQTPPADPIAEIMSSLLPVHSAMTQEWLADAASMAAERGLGALFAFIFLEEQDGALAYKAPASDLRRRSHQRAADALGTILFRTTIDPQELPVIGEALDAGSSIAAPVTELFSPLITEDRAAAAAKELAADFGCVAPLENAGERLGALVVLGRNTIEPAHVRLLADHIACASVNLRNADLSREQGVIDVVRSVFDARKIESELQRELARAARYKRNVSICVIEATNLRLLRERFGDFLTDRLLQRMGESLAQHAREIDVIGAYRESGYTMILTEATASDAAAAAQRLMATAASIELDGGEGVPGLELHLAIGHATCPEDGATTDALYAAAERRMYGGAASQVA
jgi:diguanylate cyclase (GGDEF)-like protein